MPSKPYDLHTAHAAHGKAVAAAAATLRGRAGTFFPDTTLLAGYGTARDEAVARQWDFHNAILGAKTQVAAQFGPDSNEIQALGMKKKSEYVRPARRRPGNTGSGQ